METSEARRREGRRPEDIQVERAGGPSNVQEGLDFFCHSATPFRLDGSLDEDAFRVHLRRLVAARNGIFVGSPGAGESSSLTLAELRRVYEIGAEEGKGKVPVFASTREARSAAAMYEVAREAVAAGVDVVQLHQLDGGHGMVPTEQEQRAYFQAILEATDHPVAISIHSALGYAAPITLLAELCTTFRQICAISLVGPSFSYQVALQAAIPSSVKILTGGASFVHGLVLGAAGTQSPWANVAPVTYRAIADAYLEGDLGAMSVALREYELLQSIINRWGPGAARAIKLALKVLELGNGAIRAPYLAASEADEQAMATALEASGIRELVA
jgi:4-hydroxy-tetrahydrodipicolinate synthase